MLYKLETSKPIDFESEITIKWLVDKIVFSGKLSRKHHSLLTAIILAEDDIAEGERRQINRIFDRIQTGQIKVLDW